MKISLKEKIFYGVVIVSLASITAILLKFPQKARPTNNWSVNRIYLNMQHAVVDKEIGSTGILLGSDIRWIWLSKQKLEYYRYADLYITYRNNSVESISGETLEGANVIFHQGADRDLIHKFLGTPFSVITSGKREQFLDGNLEVTYQQNNVQYFELKGSNR